MEAVKPGSLGDAISITERIELARKALGNHIFTRFTELKKKEWEDYRIQVTQYEIEKYLPVL